MKERVLRKRLAGAGLAFAVTTAAFAVFGLLLSAPSAGADMVQTNDGKWFPEPKQADGVPPLGPDDTPTDDMLMQSEGFKVDATYETVKGAGFTKSAGLVKRIWSTDRVKNEAFKTARIALESGQWKDAAEGLGDASGALSGYGKQEALWLRAVAYANLGTKDELLAALTDLLAAFPKSYYFCDAQIYRAKVAIGSGDAEGASKALSAVAAEKGMNPRDQYRAEYTRINLTLELAKKYEDARAAYQKLVDTISRGDAVQGEFVSLQANVGIGNCLVRAGKVKEAEPFFTKATESHNADVLAGAYAGLGDIAQMQAKELSREKNLPAAKARLEDALLAYLRVTLHYKDDCEDTSTVLRALDNQGQIYFTLFDMSGGKDQDAFDRGYSAFYELWRSLPDGSAPKRDIQKKMSERKAARDSAAPPKAPPPAMGP